MARKKRSGENKSALIREMFGTMGLDASPRDVAAALGEKNVQVTPPQVSNVKLQMRKKQGLKGLRRRGRPPGRKPGRPVGSGRSANLSLETLLAAKDLANKLGGVEAAKQALEVLSRLS